MKLSKEQIQKLKSSMCINKCPNCGEKDFQISDSEYHLVSCEREGDNYDLSGTIDVMNLAACICNKCGFVSFFNLGIIDDLKK